MTTTDNAIRVIARFPCRSAMAVIKRPLPLARTTIRVARPSLRGYWLEFYRPQRGAVRSRDMKAGQTALGPARRRPKSLQLSQGSTVLRSAETEIRSLADQQPESRESVLQQSCAWQRFCTQESRLAPIAAPADIALLNQKHDCVAWTET